MNYELIINPIVTPGVVAVIISAALLVLVIMNKAAILNAFGTVREKIFTRAGLFWAVNLVFMGISVLHAGMFFGITGGGHKDQSTGGVGLSTMTQALGFAVSFFLDLVTIILMQAMLEARYRGEEGRARQFLLFIAICCGTSTFANLAISLNDFDAAAMLPNAPFWVQGAAPYVLASFPLFVILMSIAAEMIINVRPLDSLDEEEYEADEQKRVNILQIRNNYLQRQADEELRTLSIRAQMKMNKQLRKGKTLGSFRWFWEKPLDVDTIIAGVTVQLKALYEPEIEGLKRRLEETQNQANTATSTVGITGRSAARKTSSIQHLNGKNAMRSNGTTVSGSQTTVLDEITDGEDDEILSSINAIPTTLDVDSLDLSPDVAEVVRRYPGVYIHWLSQSVKSVFVDEIVAVTRQPKRRVSFQVGKALKVTSRNENKVLVSSVIEWLKTAPSVAKSGGQDVSHTDELPSVNPPNDDHSKETIDLDEIENKLAMTLAVLQENPTVTDEALANELGLDRPEMAQFWRAKAQSMLEQEQQSSQQNGHARKEVDPTSFPPILV